jgi:protein-S-isoprenylcysteine O-methyltransferase Ste14
MLWLKTIFFTIIAPGTVAGLVPYWLLGAKLHRQISLWEHLSLTGLSVAILGFAIYLWCAVDFIRKGHGTPAPYDPPRILVINGLYRFVRNPMYLGVVSIILGEAIFFRTNALLLYAALVLLAFHLRVLRYEEPTLRRLFGDAYVKYYAVVPRWLPKVSSGVRGHD